MSAGQGVRAPLIRGEVMYGHVDAHSPRFNGRLHGLRFHYGGSHVPLVVAPGLLPLLPTQHGLQRLYALVTRRIHRTGDDHLGKLVGVPTRGERPGVPGSLKQVLARVVSPQCLVPPLGGS